MRHTKDCSLLAASCSPCLISMSWVQRTDTIFCRVPRRSRSVSTMTYRYKRGFKIPDLLITSSVSFITFPLTDFSLVISHIFLFGILCSNFFFLITGCRTLWISYCWVSGFCSFLFKCVCPSSDRQVKVLADQLHILRLVFKLCHCSCTILFTHGNLAPLLRYDFFAFSTEYSQWSRKTLLATWISDISTENSYMFLVIRCLILWCLPPYTFTS